MGKKGSCMATSSGDLDDNKLMICQIMQKFRPIAPKPLPDDGNALTNCVVSSAKGTERVKRKYSRKKKGDCKKNTLFKKKEEILGNKSGSMDVDDDEVVNTLQLFPSNLECLGNKSGDNKCCLSGTKSSAEDIDELKTLLPKCPYDFLESSSSSLGEKEEILLMKQEVRIIETWIIVECLTGVRMDNLLLGLSDNEKFNNLQLDFSPCFVSDNLDNVVFVNEAYKKMVMKNNNNFLENNYTKLKVELVMKEKVPTWFPKAFSGTARLIEYKWRRGQLEKFSRTVPCDVWRMEIGGFAWKLDIKTALGLAL